ncbi:MAG TPA: exodeoxyribonuclease III [Candidatus Heimdallarchaeota archaeon]|nr:exodeoxyribonuclease III [Candidatus Heimdallarchaeota archaeon]
MTFKVATFNTNSVRARTPIVLAWLEKNGPDVLCLQETKVRDDAFPKEAFVEAGYRPLFQGEKSYNGVAMLIREPADVKNVRYGLDDDGPPDESRLLVAEVRGIPIVNTYVPQGQDPKAEIFQYKLAWFARLRSYFDRHFLPQEPLLWVGDFNVAPERIDVHDPGRLLGHVGFHPDEHKALAAVKAWGFVDVFRKHVPGPNQYTFWDYRVKDGVARGKRWRVDHIWATAPLADRSKRAWIDPDPRLAERPSDHTVLAAEFNIP